MKFNPKIIAFLSALLVFSSCAHQAIPNGFNTFDMDNPKGLIIGTITFPNNAQTFERYFFHINAVGEKSDKNDTEIDIDVRLPYSSSIKKIGNSTTYLFAIRRTPGTYEIDHVRLFANGIYQYHGWLSKFSIPFSVKPGAITYIGEIKYNESAKDIHNYIGLTDNYERDINLFKLLNAKIDWDKTDKSIERKINYE